MSWVTQTRGASCIHVPPEQADALGLKHDRPHADTGVGRAARTPQRAPWVDTAPMRLKSLGTVTGRLTGVRRMEYSAVGDEFDDA